MPQFGHVVVVIGENKSFAATYHSGAMPYLDSLANTYGVATNYSADTHPSIGNYMVLTTGRILTNDDSQTPASFPVSVDNIALDTQKAGKTWKDYVENLPADPGCGGLTGGSYYARHDPLEYMTTVNGETAHYVCFSQFATDLASNELPNLSWLVPNGCDNGHDCSAASFDTWLKAELGPLLQSQYFQPGGDGLLLITFDEDSGSGGCGLSTGTGCGGQVETVVISPAGKPGYRSPNAYEHENLLRTVAAALGLNPATLGAAATAAPMADFFGGTATGKNYYVSPDGSDSTGDGSAARPWATIAYASTQIGPGATVHVAPGSYAGNISTNVSGTSGARITYISDTPHAARIFNAAWNGDLNQSVWVNVGSFVTIEGFDVSGYAFQGIDNSGANVVIQGNHVHNVVPHDCNGNGGAGIDDYGNDSDDIGNIVNDVGNFSLGTCAYVHGIYADRTGGHVWNNLIYHNWSFGIQVWGSSPQNVTISGNTVFNNGASGLVIGAETKPAANMLVTDNIFVDNHAYGFEEEGLTGGGNRYMNNLTYGNGLRDLNLQTGSATGNITGQNPMLVNLQPDGGDEHLTGSSPAINAGTSEGAPSYDFDGNPRPEARSSGNGWDIGAYQFTGAT